MVAPPRMTASVLKVVSALLAEPGVERYGMQLMQETGLASGTLYPILVRLERAGWVAARWEDVDPAAAGRPGRDRAIMAGRPLLAPAGVTLAAGALFNLVHLVSRSVPVPARTPVELGALAVAVAAMARLGLVGAGWSAPRRPVAATVLTGLALYGFLLAGNPDPVMPFMGWRDI